MWTGQRSASRRFVVAAIAALAIPMLTVGWLGWMLLDQEAELAESRATERPRAAADLAANVVTKAVDDVDARLATLLDADGPDARLAAAEAPGDGALFVVIDQNGLWSSRPLAFYPDDHLAAATVADSAPSPFLDGERLEYRRNLTGALAAYQRLAGDANRSIRAGALARIGRVARNLGRHDEALRAYRALEAFGGVPVLVGPADLLATTEQCDLLHELGRHDELIAAARALDGDLLSGRWRLARDQLVFYRGELASLVPDIASDETTPWPVVLAAGVGRVAALAGAEEAGLAAFDLDDDAGVIVWRRREGRTAAFIATAAFAGATWLPDLEAIERVQGVRISVADAAARRWAGDESGAQSVVVNGPLFVVTATPAEETVAGGAPAGRQSLILGIVVAFAALLLVGGYLSARGVGRELAAARLQSDFVAAVSHEFRTTYELWTLDNVLAVINSR